jgi:phosphatidylglycerophosphatase A
LGLWVAQGFGVGRIPIAPGTFGSVLGVGWFALLMAAGNPWALVLGSLAGLAMSVWLCGAAEKALGQTDPGSVVLDEITAMPVCFLSWVSVVYWKQGIWPGVAQFFGGGHWAMTLGVFAAFRLFDVWKPWPVRQSQALPGGWGVTVDDFLAAIYVNVLVVLGYGAKVMMRHG